MGVLIVAIILRKFNPPPEVDTSKTTISTTCAGTITSDMRMGGDNIPQYTPIYAEGFQGCWRMQ